MTRILMAMSGGVDSSAAAALLVKNGNEVIGVSMKLWPSELCGQEKAKSCCSTRDLKDARFVCSQLGIPFYALDLSKEFKKYVMDYFCKEYINGRTPNPCIVCNNKIKFGRLLEKAKELDCDYIATGHYANVKYNNKSGRFILKQGRDKAKDQSYVLFGLNQKQLKATIFPLGEYLKSEVRKISEDLKLKVAQKPESQEICFIWDDNYPKFLESRYGIKPAPGDIITKDGRILGSHPGVMFFTIGQRRGLGLGGNKKPLYVVDIDTKNNRLIVGPLKEAGRKSLFAKKLNWIGIDKPDKPLRIKAKIRYNHIPAEAVVYPAAEDRVRVEFKKPQFAVTPGQAVVFYKGNEVLGGGWIQ